MSLVTRVVVFGSVDGEASGVQLFADALTNVNSDGTPKTEYYPGDSVNLLLIVPDTYKLLAVKSTDGSIVATGSVTRTEVDRILFTEKGIQQQLSQLPAGSVTPGWYGASGVLTVDGQQVAANAAPCIADLAYSYQAERYQLTAPASLAIGAEDGDDWPIGVVAYVEKIK